MSMEALRSNRSERKLSFFLMILLIGIFLLENSPLSRIFDAITLNYIVIPIIWFGIAFFIWSLPRVKPKAKLRLRPSINVWAFSFAFIYLVVSITAGIFYGFGKSPYSHTLSGILINFICVGSALLGKELIRNYLVNSLTKRENYILFSLIALLITVIELPINKLLEINSLRGLVEYIALYLAPEFSHNIWE
jgi:signal peptidase